MNACCTGFLEQVYHISAEWIERGKYCLVSLCLLVYLTVIVSDRFLFYIFCSQSALGSRFSAPGRTDLNNVSCSSSLFQLVVLPLVYSSCVQPEGNTVPWVSFTELNSALCYGVALWKLHAGYLYPNFQMYWQGQLVSLWLAAASLM